MINPQVRANIERSFQAKYGRLPTDTEVNQMVSSTQQGAKPNIPSVPSTGEQIGRTALQAGGVGLAKEGVKAAWNAATASTPTLATPSVIGAERIASAPTAIGAERLGSSSSAVQGGLGSTVGNTLGVAGGLYSAYELGKGLEKASKYKQSGSDLAMTTGVSALQGAGVGGGVAAGLGLLGATGVGFVPALALGALFGGGAGLGAGLMGSGKKTDQIMRDKIRDNYQEAGLIGDDYMLNNFDIGKDGGFRTDRGTRVQEVDFKEQGAREAVGALNPLGWLTSGIEDQEMKGMSTGMLYNALSADDGVTMDEVRGLYDKAGLDQASAFEGVTKLYNEGLLTEQEARAGQAALNELYGQEYYSPEDEEERERLANQGLQYLMD